MATSSDLTEYIQISPKADSSLVAQLVEQLTWLIVVELVQPGELLPPIRRLAASLGVHMHTVRAAYHRLEAEGLVDVRRRRGTLVLPFDPIQLVSAEPSVSSFLFGVLLPSQEGVYQEFARGIYITATEFGWMPLFAFTRDNPQLADSYFKQLLAKKVDGFIVVSNPIHAGLLQIDAIAEYVPIVHVDAPHRAVNSIMVDSEKAAQLVTEHLLQHGHQRVALITPPLHWEPIGPIYRGYRAALEAKGLKMEASLIIEVPDFSQESGRTAIRRILELEKPPTAAIFAADSLAFGGLSALQEHGIAVPEELALASYNNLAESALVSPPITSATFPAFDLAEAAVELLVKLHKGEVEEGGRIVLESELVIRKSCGC